MEMEDARGTMGSLSSPSRRSSRASVISLSSAFELLYTVKEAQKKPLRRRGWRGRKSREINMGASFASLTISETMRYLGQLEAAFRTK